MSSLELFHKQGIKQIVVLKQDGYPRKRGNQYSFDTTLYDIVALDETGHAFRGTYIYKYSVQKGENLSRGAVEDATLEEHARLVEKLGTMEVPKPIDPQASSGRSRRRWR